MSKKSKKTFIVEARRADESKHTNSANGLEWNFPKCRGGNERPGNISVTVRKDRVAIGFRKGTHKNFSLNRLVYAVDGGRLYFAENSDGFTLSKVGSAYEISTADMSVGAFAGYYSLQYDGDRGLFLIDVNNKIV